MLLATLKCHGGIIGVGEGCSSKRVRMLSVCNLSDSPQYNRWLHTVLNVQLLDKIYPPTLGGTLEILSYLLGQ